MQDCQYDGDCQNGKFWSEHRFLFLGWSLEVFFQGFSLRSPGIFSRVPSGLSWVFYPWLSFYGTLYMILSQGYPLQSPGVSLQGQRSLSTCFSSCLPFFWLLILLCFYNLGGRCIQNAVNVEPKRECYCPVGSFGKNCQNKSPLSTKSYNQSEYNIVPLNGPDFKFMWKLMGSYQDTLEGIIVAKTTSYVALGKSTISQR